MRPDKRVLMSTVLTLLVIYSCMHKLKLHVLLLCRLIPASTATGVAGAAAATAATHSGPYLYSTSIEQRGLIHQ